MPYKYCRFCGHEIEIMIRKGTPYCCEYCKEENPEHLIEVERIHAERLEEGHE